MDQYDKHFPGWKFFSELAIGATFRFRWGKHDYLKIDQWLYRRCSCGPGDGTKRQGNKDMKVMPVDNH